MAPGSASCTGDGSASGIPRQRPSPKWRRLSTCSMPPARSTCRRIRAGRSTGTASTSAARCPASAGPAGSPRIRHGDRLLGQANVLLMDDIGRHRPDRPPGRAQPGRRQRAAAGGRPPRGRRGHPVARRRGDRRHAGRAVLRGARLPVGVRRDAQRARPVDGGLVAAGRDGAGHRLRVPGRVLPGRAAASTCSRRTRRPRSRCATTPTATSTCGPAPTTRSGCGPASPR